MIKKYQAQKLYFLRLPEGVGQNCSQKSCLYFTLCSFWALEGGWEHSLLQKRHHLKHRPLKTL